MLHILSNYLKTVVNCQWNIWKSSSHCSVTCGEGSQTQKRTKSVEEAAGGNCTGMNQTTIQCYQDNCTTPGISLLLINVKVVKMKVSYLCLC